MALLSITACLIASAFAQDSGQKAAQLQSQISGTLAQAQPFQAASTRVDAAASQGFLAAATPVSLPDCGNAYQLEQTPPDCEDQI